MCKSCGEDCILGRWRNKIWQFAICKITGQPISHPKVAFLRNKGFDSRPFFLNGKPMVDYYIAITFLCRWVVFSPRFLVGKMIQVDLRFNQGQLRHWKQLITSNGRKSQRRKGGNRWIFGTVKWYIYIYICILCVLTSPMGMTWVPFFLCISACHRGVFFLTWPFTTESCLECLAAVWLKNIGV